ncbi:type IV pilin protein [Acinetobacter sp.]|uniref:type IV pilin protein n=1 Tax=Acinetobacter sp. TaxID=472 RepID=UPI0035B26C85
METAINRKGFTLVELLVVIAILGIIAAIAFPSYKSYVQKTKRTEVQAEMAEIASKLQRFKLANFHYEQSRTTAIPPVITAINLTRVGYTTGTPVSENGLYNYSLAFNPAATSWTLTASPISSGMQKGNGGLTLTSAGQQCWYKGKDSFDASADTCFGWNEK